MAYSDKTGRYELMDTASLSEGEQVTAAEALAAKNAHDSGHGAGEQPSEDAATADGEKDRTFSIAWGFNRSLDATEKQGFVLIALATAAGIVVLATLFFKVVRKRKK